MSSLKMASLSRPLVLRGAAVFVGGVWAAMALFALYCIARYGSNVPIAEDWLIVPALTGNETDVFGWLWAQNNEHRVPLPRLLLLGLVTLAGGDFRAGMVFNVLALAALALAMILVARGLRGHVSYADAFFPVALLHMGHWENLVWSWQVQFVSSMVITSFLLLIMVKQGARPSSPLAVLAGLLTVLLPLGGANGLIFVPAVALWLAYAGLGRWRNQENATGTFLLAASLLACALAAAYFIGYERPTWNPSSPGLVATLQTTAKFLAIGFGPAASALWSFFALAALTFLLASAAILLAGVWRKQAAEQQRALVLALFFGTFAVFALAMGWGRAGLVPSHGMPARYALLSVMGFACAYFIWQLYGPKDWRRAVQAGLLLVMLLLVPANTSQGFGWRDWYLQGVSAVQQDITAGLPASLLAERHRAFLLHWDQAKLEANLRMLQAAGIGPFAHMADEASVEEVVLSGSATLQEDESLTLSLASQRVIAVRLYYTGGAAAGVPFHLTGRGPGRTELEYAEWTPVLGQEDAVTFWVGGVLESIEIWPGSPSGHELEQVTLLAPRGD